MGYEYGIEISEFVGKTFKSIDVECDTITFFCEDGTNYIMYHQQDCCEEVEVEDIVGEIENLLNTPVVVAECVQDSGESDWGTSTWTFYKLATKKGYVTIRWFGESNGYYSEKVDIKKEKVW